LKLFLRCNSGHFFTSDVCPWDGWSHPSFKLAIETFNRLELEGKPVSIESLRNAGLDEEALQRVVILEFGDPQVALDGIYPKQVMVNGRLVNPSDLDWRFK